MKTINKLCACQYAALKNEIVLRNGNVCTGLSIFYSLRKVEKPKKYFSEQPFLLKLSKVLTLVKH